MQPHLREGERGLELVSGSLTIRGDFTRMANRLKPSNLNRELLVRAAKIRGATSQLTAIDATAGLGEDSLLLAAAGFEVTMYERNPTIAALLKDAIERASLVPNLCAIVEHMHVVEGNSIDGLRNAQTEPDIVLLDPMFPEKHKRASAKKKLQLLQQLESPCEDEIALLEAAIAANPRKVVIKRPVKGPYLAGRKPDYSLTGKTIRYDCITCRTH